MKNKCFVLTLFLFLIGTTFTSFFNADTDPLFLAEAAIVIDADDGSVLYKDDEGKKLGIASITKLMTVYVAMEEIKEKKINMNEETYISEKAQALKFQAEDISGVYFTEGQAVTIEELIHLGLIFSDNGAMVQLAETISGSEEKHVVKMNEKAKNWGLYNTNFVNVTGLTMGDYGEYMLEGSKKNEYNVSTAFELSKMIFYITQEYPELLEITKQVEYEFNGETVVNWNMMLEGKDVEYPGVIGMKTGSSLEAGYCFASYFSKNENENYITVVLNSEDTYSRFTDTVALLDWAKNQDITKAIDTNANVPLLINNDIINVHPKYSLSTSENLLVNGFIKGVVYNEEFFDKNGNVIKDIPAGETIGELKMEKVGETASSNIFSEENTLTIPLISNENISKMNFLKKKTQGITVFFKEYLVS